MVTPTREYAELLRAKRDALKARCENFLLERRNAGVDELAGADAERFRHMSVDLAELEQRTADYYAELERVGSLPPGLAAKVAGRPVRGGMTGAQLSPLDPPLEELRRMHEAVLRGQAASYEKRFTSADSLLPPELFPYPIAQIHENRLLGRLPSWAVELPSVEYIRHVSTTGVAGSVAEGGLKPQVTLNVDKLVAAVVKLSAMITLTREIYADWEAFSQYALQELQRQVIDVENLQLLTGTGTGTNMTGFYNTPGILTHDASADTGETVWDSFEKCIAQLRVGSALATPDVIVLNPLDWSAAAG